MSSAFKLTPSNTQEGNFNLNNREIQYKIGYNDYVSKYTLSLYDNDVLLIGGMFLSDGADILYNEKYLGLGTSLKFKGNADLSGDCYLIYEE